MKIKNQFQNWGGLNLKLLFLNNLRSLFKNKIGIIVLILLIIISQALYAAINLSIDRTKYKYEEYLKEQNVEQLSFKINIDYKNDVTLEDIEYLEHKNLTEDEKLIIDEYKINKNEALIIMIENLLKKYNIDIIIEKRKIDILKEKYNFTYELTRSKEIKENGIYIKIIPLDLNAKINKPYLVKGKFPINDDEVTILPNFAYQNNININDYYKVLGKKYKVIGYTYASDYIYPIISNSNPIYDIKRNNIIYINEQNYQKIKGIESKIYSITFKDEKNKKDFLNEKIINIDSDSNIRESRINMLKDEIKSDEKFADKLVSLFLFITSFIMIIVIKKRIDMERKEIGILKALGYNNFKIMLSYLIYPLSISIIGSLLGYLIGFILHVPLYQINLNNFAIPISSYYFNLKYLFNFMFISVICLGIISILLITLTLNKKIISLFKENDNLKINFILKIINFLTNKLPFKYRFKYSLAFKSLFKLIGVFIISFCACILITLSLTLINLIDNLLENSFRNINYKYAVQTNISDKKYDDSDYVFTISTNIDLIEHNNKNKKIDKKEVIISGIDKDIKLLKIRDNKNNDLIDKIEDNNVVISKNMADIININKNDKIILNLNNREYKLNVIDIATESHNFSIYIDRKYISKQIGFNDSVYNVLYSNNNRYNNLNKLSKEEVDNIVDVISTENLKKNMKNKIKQYSITIYMIVISSLVISLLVIILISNIIINENKRNISLMKVIGYKEKDISSIILNIYTPIIIISYFIGIKVTAKILKMIMKDLSFDIGLTFPVNIDLKIILIGLFLLLFIYFLALTVSKKRLSKISLNEVLKVE